MTKEKLVGKITASIVIPVYNTEDLLRRNLPKVLEAKKVKSNNIIEIIVVDDASPDESAAVVKKEFPEVSLIKHTVNRGFSATVNTGARAAMGKLLVLLNSDVIPTKNFLSEVFDDFRDPSVFAVSLHEKGYTWAKGYFAGGYIGHKQGKGDKKLCETFWVSGGSAVYRRDYWMKLGGMDEKLLSPFYWEDIDLSYRAAKRGLVNLWEPKAVVEHKHETTMSQLNPRYVAKIRERNQLLFHWKNITSGNLFKKHIFGVLARIAQHPGYLRVVFMAFTRLPLALRSRRKEIKESKVADEAIFAKFQNE
jgi:GT2 family glycosyltransferase